MTEKQVKAIERCNELIKESHSCWIGLSNQDAIRIVLSLVKEQNEIIDYMAELIARKVGARIEICHNMNCDKTIEKECKKCAKEYFKRKVTDTNVGEMVEN